MRPEKLMIGDWVSLFQGNPDGSSCNVQVTFVGEYGEVGIEGCEEYTSANCNLLFPIPLTAEILEKNGFEFNNLPMEQCWQQYGLRLYLSGHGYGINCGENVSLCIDYVHELQHALRLCGIDKEIEL